MSEKVYIKIERKDLTPVKGTELSSGYDIFAKENPTIVFLKDSKETRVDTNNKGQIINFHTDNLVNSLYIEYKTGIYLSPESNDIDIMIFPRSSISNKDLILCNSVGLVDTDYTGEIICRFKYLRRNNPNRGYITGFKELIDLGYRLYEAGDRIAQIRVSRTTPIEFDFNFDREEVKKEPVKGNKRGENGFGSTGK